MSYPRKMKSILGLAIVALCLALFQVLLPATTTSLAFADSTRITDAGSVSTDQAIGDATSVDIQDFLAADADQDVSLSETSASKGIAVLPYYDWKGEYDGNHNSVKVRRNLELHINSVTTSGTIEGIGIISPSDKASSSYAANGSYKFKGTYNFTTHAIKLQGYEWIDYPVGYSNFGFMDFSGTVNTVDGSISGKTSWGIWEMTAVDYTPSAFKDSGFTIGKDSNNFRHSRSSFNDDQVVALDDMYYKALTDGSSASEKNAFKVTQEGKFWNSSSGQWGGVCYGIAATMSMLHEGNLDISQLTLGTAQDYYGIGSPGSDSRLKNVIYYYYLTQYLEKYKIKNIANSYVVNYDAYSGVNNWSAGGDSLSVFLKHMVEYASSGKTGIFAFLYSTGGHAIVITGCSFNQQTNEYEIKLFDENSYKDSSSNGAFSTMYVAKDYSAYRYTDANGTTINQSTFNSLYLVDPSNMKPLNDSASGSSNNSLYIEIPTNASFLITDDRGNYLECKGGTYSGNMKVYDITPVVDGDSSRMSIEVPADRTYTITNLADNTPIAIRSNSGYTGGSASGASQIVITPGSEISFVGDSVSFTAYMSTEKVVKGNETALFKVSGEKGKNVCLKVSGEKLSLSSDNGKVCNVKAKYLRGQKSTEVNLGDCSNGKQIGSYDFPDAIYDNDYAMQFAMRLYTEILGREPDQSGLQTQYQALLNGAQPADIAYNYFNGAEFKAMGLSNEEVVQRVYRVMFGRDADYYGMQFWKAYLDNGMTVYSVIQGFSEATEYKEYFAYCELNNSTVSRSKLCPRDRSYGATAFAYRLYTIVLNRQAESEGLDVQSAAMQNGMPCVQIAVNFFCGDEFTARDLSANNVIKICYKAMLGREAQSGELSYWVSRLNSEGLASVVRGFCQSDEFETICRSYGLTSGMR